LGEAVLWYRSLALGGHVFPADDGSNMSRLFIRARLSDNLIGLANDPGYEQRLEGLGSAQLVRALKEGDWSVVEGAFFPEFRDESHVVTPVALSPHWTRIRAMDWGSARPFCVGWFAVSDGELRESPRGALVMYREWYGVASDGHGGYQPNVGLKMTAEEVGAGIRNREIGESVSLAVLDPSAFSQDGGPSIAERMGARFGRADNKRVPRAGAMGGWDQVRARLKGEEGRPMLYFFDTCVHTIRTLPAMQHDPLRPEDMDTESEDHAVDCVRYACMARLYVKDLPPPEIEGRSPLRQSGSSGRSRRGSRGTSRHAARRWAA
jgi:hypothetical protein